MTETPQRETAQICTIKDIFTGEYIIQEGWLANHISINGRLLSRVNIIGVVVSKPTPYNFSIDDGTGTISVVDFNKQKKVEELKIGDPVLLIGRPRQNNLTKFIACEIINNKQLLEEPGWIPYRQEQLKKIPKEIKNKSSTLPSIRSITENEIIIKEDKNTTQKPIISEITELISADVTGENIISFIKKNDSNDGCLIEEIVSHFGDKVDKHVLSLITMGEIYEIKPGRVKVLE